MFNNFMKYIYNYFSSLNKFIPLRQGDTVHAISPSGNTNIEPDKLQDHLDDIKGYIESLGLKADIMPNIYDPDVLFYANSDQLRAKDLIDALTDDSKVVWCIKGGSGAMRLIPYLEEELPSVLPKKLFIGYSDITSLHIYLQNKYGWPTILGPMLGQIVTGHNDKGSIDKLQKIIFSEVDSINFDNVLKISNEKADSENIEITGKIVGGNLTLVECSLGTDWPINTDNKILFLEDINVQPYAIARSLDHMKQAHVFDNVKAVIFGDFQGTDEKLLEYLEKDFATSILIPVFKMTGIGHGKVNDPLPLNVSASLRLGDDHEHYHLSVGNIFTS